MAANLNKLKKVRIQKLAALEKGGRSAYPDMPARTSPVSAILKQFDELVVSQRKLYVAGRVMARREHGGATFIDLYDGTGKLQLHLKQDLVGIEGYKQFIDYVDVGDIIESLGPFFITRRGEQTQEVESFRVLAKALLPLPEKWHGLADVDERFRKRYLDLLMNEEVREVFVRRSRMVKALREFFDNEGFMEVETPILHTIAGGAIARPFKTKLNALQLDLYLRIAPELHLKRLIVGGYHKVYEVARCFRNEGMDAAHNPDFTMLECYAAYEDYRDMMARVERMMRAVIARTVPDSHLQIERSGKMIDFQSPFSVVEFKELIKKYADIDYDAVTLAAMAKKARSLGVDVPKGAGKGKLADEIYKKLARPQIIQPTFVVHHPLEISPLAKQSHEGDEQAARFQLVAAGMELTNGYSELNDPVEQRKRFKAQDALRKKGDDEVQRIDEEFVEALEHGMPPAAGLGVGIERLAALLTGTHAVREVMLFPTMRPKKKR